MAREAALRAGGWGCVDGGCCCGGASGVEDPPQGSQEEDVVVVVVEAAWRGGCCACCWGGGGVVEDWVSFMSMFMNMAISRSAGSGGGVVSVGLGAAGGAGVIEDGAAGLSPEPSGLGDEEEEDCQNQPMLMWFPRVGMGRVDGETELRSGSLEHLGSLDWVRRGEVRGRAAVQRDGVLGVLPSSTLRGLQLQAKKVLSRFGPAVIGALIESSGGVRTWRRRWACPWLRVSAV